MESLVHQYKTEFEDRYEGILKRGVEQIQFAQNSIQFIQPAIQFNQKKLIAFLQDTKLVTEGYAKIILEIFAWTTVMVFASRFMSILTSYLLAPIITLFIGGATAMLLGFVVVPVIVMLNAEYTLSDIDIRYNLILFAAIEGVLTGFLFTERYLLTMQPLAFVSPLVIALTGALAEDNIGTARVPLLGATVGVSAMIHLIIGIIFGSLSFSYMLTVVAYSAAGVVFLQYLFQETEYTYVYSSGKAYIIMFGYFVVIEYTQLVVFALFGGPKPNF